MRPPEHWHLRRRRASPWWAIGMVALIVASVFLVRAALSDGDVPKAVMAPTVVPTHTSEVLSAGPSFAFDTPPPGITGRSTAIIESSCRQLLYGLQPHDRLAPASLSKIATALVAVEQADLSELVDVRVDSSLMALSSRSSVMGLKPGQRLSIRDLLYGLLLPSGNDAAVAIAEHVAGGVPAFVALMNERVAALGLTDTRFANPHGLDDIDNYTSAYDIAILGAELLADPTLAQIVAAPSHQPAWSGPPVWNGNRLIYEYQGMIGVKTGYTSEAGQTIVAAAERDGRTLIVAVLGAWDRYADARFLLDWAFAYTEPDCPTYGPPER